MKIAIAVIVLVLGGCASPYDYALSSPQPVEPPPWTGRADDLQALLPYDASPWFDG